ncbi:hypothetical protein [Ideonella paludis]|uniref:hypothetical protein n=1 Tax=Ideonella paludis TaxID=1233411 RepID=UPI003624C45B
MLALDSWVKRHRRLLAVRSLGHLPVDFLARAGKPCWVRKPTTATWGKWRTKTLPG